jgi:hypothetical protein
LFLLLNDQLLPMDLPPDLPRPEDSLLPPEDFLDEAELLPADELPPPLPEDLPPPLFDRPPDLEFDLAIIIFLFL